MQQQMKGFVMYTSSYVLSIVTLSFSAISSTAQVWESGTPEKCRMIKKKIHCYQKAKKYRAEWRVRNTIAWRNFYSYSYSYKFYQSFNYKLEESA